MTHNYKYSFAFYFNMHFISNSNFGTSSFVELFEELLIIMSYGLYNEYQ